MSDSNDDMIGSEYPAIQQLIKNRLAPGETLRAFATAISVPISPSVQFVPIVGSLLALGSAAAAKGYILAVTEKRLLIIQFNKFARFTKAIREVSFEDAPIRLIKSAVAKERFLDWWAGDSFKLALGDGRKYHFRKIGKEQAAVLRDAILGVWDL